MESCVKPIFGLLTYDDDAITDIINSIVSGSFPDLWKTALIHILPKSANPTSIKGIRKNSSFSN